MTVTAIRQDGLPRAAAEGCAVGAAGASSGPVVAPDRAGAATEPRVAARGVERQQTERPSILTQSTGGADVADAVT
jgi:hypothetical protein